MTKFKHRVGRKRTDETRALIKARSLVQGDARTEAVKTRLNAAMQTIREEVTASGGVYPHNNGVLSNNEVCRRASTSFSTIYGAKYSKILPIIAQFVEDIKNANSAQDARARKSHAERAADWRDRYQCLQESHRITELDLQSTEAKLEAANQVIEKLISAKQLLEQKLQAVTKGRVTPLRPE